MQKSLTNLGSWLFSHHLCYGQFHTELTILHFLSSCIKKISLRFCAELEISKISKRAPSGIPYDANHCDCYIVQNDNIKLSWDIAAAVFRFHYCIFMWKYPTFSENQILKLLEKASSWICKVDLRSSFTVFLLFKFFISHCILLSTLFIS